MGGFLAQPARFYPDLFPADGLFGRYPYLLPNLVAVVVVVLAIVQGIFFLEETNPRSAREAAAAADLAAAREQEFEVDTAIVEDEEIDENTPLTSATAAAQAAGALGGRASGSSGGGGHDSEAAAARRRSSVMSTSMARPQFIEEGLPVPVQPSFDLRRSSFGTVHAIRVGHGSTTTAATDAMAEVREQYQYGASETTTATTSGTATPTSSSNSQSKKSGKGKGSGAFNFTVIMLTVALVLVSYHQMAFVTLLPTHLLDDPSPGYGGGGRLDLRGGLGYTVHDVGVYLSVNGVLGLLIQGLVFPPFVDRVGVWRSFVSMVVLYPLAYVVMPFVSVFPSSSATSASGGEGSGGGSSQQSALIYLALVLQSVFGIIVIPCALILLKDATPSPRVLGRVNGLAMSGCCLARTVSPPLVGVIYAAGGSAAAWFSCAGFALLGILQLAWVPRSKNARDLVVVEVENALVRTDSRPVDGDGPRPHGGGEQRGG